MAEDEIEAVLAQLRKVVGLMKREDELTDEERNEFELAAVLMKTMMSHRRSLTITPAQALEMATLINETTRLGAEKGILEMPFEEGMAAAQQLLDIPEPTKN